MPSYNHVILIGHLGRDPEIKYLESGRAVCNFSLATSERWRDSAGDPVERTDWHRIVAWGKTAELCKEYLSKGRAVLVEGRLQSREWEDKEGAKRTTVEVVASRVVFLGSAEGKKAASGGVPDEPPAGKPADGFDDDIPF